MSSEGAIPFISRRVAWCRECKRETRAWQQRTTEQGVVWDVRCHSAFWSRLATWANLRNRPKGWSVEGQFEDTPITFKDRATARKGEA